jgi:hypothetical protein
MANNKPELPVVSSVEQLVFDEGNTSQFFTLADGHTYLVHRYPAKRDEKETVYTLFDVTQGQPVSPYLIGKLMDIVLARRAEPRNDPAPADDDEAGPRSWLPGF